MRCIIWSVNRPEKSPGGTPFRAIIDLIKAFVPQGLPAPYPSGYALVGAKPCWAKQCTNYRIAEMIARSIAFRR